jgi:hypothetical protein
MICCVTTRAAVCSMPGRDAAQRVRDEGNRKAMHAADCADKIGRSASEARSAHANSMFAWNAHSRPAVPETTATPRAHATAGAGREDALSLKDREIAATSMRRCRITGRQPDCPMPGTNP